ncbi:MAG: hypothetical protein ABW032_08050 [Burkholderiaceae bacterium]
MTEIQIIGHSHTNAVRGALRRRPPQDQQRVEVMHVLVEVPDKNFSVLESDGRRRMHPAIRHKLERARPGGAAVFSQLGGNIHHFVGLFEHPRPFDFMLPDEPALPLLAGAQTVPYGYMAAVMRGRLTGDVALLAALRNSAPAGLRHLESPPPVEDNEYCQANLPPAFLKGDYQGLKVASPAFRYKLWRLHGEILRRECARLDIGFVPCPPASMDARGFLRRDLYADPLHGNELYGELVLQQIAALRHADASAALNA